MARTDVKSTTRALAGDCCDDDVDYDGSDDCGRGVRATTIMPVVAAVVVLVALASSGGSDGLLRHR